MIVIGNQSSLVLPEIGIPRVTIRNLFRVLVLTFFLQDLFQDLKALNC